MFKKYLIATAICAAGVVGGIQADTASAAANMGGDQAEQKAPAYERSTQYSGFDKFLERCFAKWNITWDDQTDTAEQPSAPEQEVEQEQPAQEETVNQPEQPAVNQPAPQPQPETEQPTEDQAANSALNEFEQQVVELTNQERVKNGLPALKADNELSKVAREKSRDIQANNYFSHDSPTYGSPFDMMESFGIDYRSAGENIAKGQRSPAEVVNAWMNSPGHRANILNGNFTHIGVGYVEQGNVWTQMFIGK